MNVSFDYTVFEMIKNESFIKFITLHFKSACIQLSHDNDTIDRPINENNNRSKFNSTAVVYNDCIRCELIKRPRYR